ncbi:Flp family type IVb pilin [Nocardioides jensenii]|uniref:Flp family type IVb pilin n=1 Tax=Nocardioides jensenii TaxID=1843 RepID=UPI00082C58D2|nr:Flp family type IVb pilin [Nocardioides jensenii]
MIEIYCKFMAFMTAERDDEKGATAVEYGLLVALIAAVIIGVVATVGTNLKDTFTEIGSKI